MGEERMSKAVKMIGIFASAAVILCIVVSALIAVSKRNAEKAAVDYNTGIADAMGYADEYNVEDSRYDVLNKTCDVLLEDNDRSVQLWYRVAEGRNVSCAAINEPGKSGHEMYLPDDAKKRNMQYDALTAVRSQRYTSFIVVTNEREDNGTYIVTLSLPETGESITAEIDTGSIDESGRYNRITFE